MTEEVVAQASTGRNPDGHNLVILGIEIEQSVVVVIIGLPVRRPRVGRVEMSSVPVTGVSREIDVGDVHVRRMPESGIELRHPAVLEEETE